ncbi:MAG: phosphatase PAP2 family protein [Chitinispirillaceae bacterium]
MRRIFPLTTFLIIGFASLLFSQNKYDFTEFEKETFEFVKQPLTWDEGDWLKLGLIGGATVLAAQADQPVRIAVFKNPGYGSTIPIQIGGTWGGWFPTPILAVGFGLHGWLDNNTSTKKVGFEIMQAVLYAELVKSIFTVSVGRARPYMNKGHAAFRPFTLLDRNYQSFPGGHATAAFALSTVLAGNTSSIFLKILAYAPAVFTVIARTYQDAHWTSDEVFGSAIGFFAASWVVDIHKQKNSQVQIISVYPPALSISF